MFQKIRQAKRINKLIDKIYLNNLKIFSSVIFELSGKFKHITINKINADINKIGLILS